MPNARIIRPADVRIGLGAEFEREVHAADILAFAENSGDLNPLHVDAEYAQGTNFARPIAHGAFQVGLASAMLGMFLPGRDVLLMTIQARFPGPLYYPGKVRVRGVVTSWSPSTMRGVLRTTVEEVSSGRITADVHTGFTFHEHVVAKRTEAVMPDDARPSTALDVRPLILVTGASGGLGSDIVRSLVGEYRVVAHTNRRGLSADLQSHHAVLQWNAEIREPWESSLDDLLGAEPLAGIVHVAWPGAPQGGLLEVDDRVIEEQIAFGSTQLVRLSRYLCTRLGATGRVVAIGSTYGHHAPNLSLAAYSLGKSVLEDTVAILAPELAKRHVTINAVCPAVVAAGMNAHLNDRQKLREIAKIPMGRLCETDDVTASIRFLLSAEAGYISGQAICLSGGML